MPTQCSRDLFGFAPVEGRRVEAAFDGGDASSDAGALLLGATDRAIGLIERFAACFDDERNAGLVEHTVVTMVAQRVFGIALGYEDLIDHDQLRHDPVLATLVGKLRARRKGCAPLAGKSTLNRLAQAPLANSRYHRISHDGPALERLLVDLFLEAHRRAPPREIVLDLDATDDPLHGRQEGRLGADRRHLAPRLLRLLLLPAAVRVLRQPPARSAAAPLEHRRLGRRGRGGGTHRGSDPGALATGRDPAPGRLRLRPRRADDVVRDPAGRLRPRTRPQRALVGAIADELAGVEAESLASGRQARHFADFAWRTLDRWSRERRVVAKAEHLPKGANPRFVVTSLPAGEIDARTLYEDVYCARGQVENRIKEQQLDLFADRTSAATMRANPRGRGPIERLWFASFA